MDTEEKSFLLGLGAVGVAILAYYKHWNSPEQKEQRRIEAEQRRIEAETRRKEEMNRRIEEERNAIYCKHCGRKYKTIYDCVHNICPKLDFKYPCAPFEGRSR